MSELILVLAPHGALPLRIPLTRRITSIGSDATADIQLATAPAHWAIIHRGEASVEVVLAETGSRQQLEIGERCEANRISVLLESTEPSLARERAIDELVSALAAVESAERAVELMLTGLIAASNADLGALILRDGESYNVAAARDRHGAVLANAKELLSDTIIGDVLGTGERVQLDDLAAHSRYAALPSIAALRIASATCLPLRLDGRVLGVVFLARHRKAALDEGTLAELRVLAALAVPFLAALRRRPTSTHDDLVGESTALGKLKSLIARVGPSDLSALLHGPSGSGEEDSSRAEFTPRARVRPSR